MAQTCERVLPSAMAHGAGPAMARWEYDVFLSPVKRTGAGGWTPPLFDGNPK